MLPLLILNSLVEPQTEKLVRDRIPELFQGSFYQAKPEQLDHFLRMKLQEEVAEFLSNPCLEEMADIVEVLEAFAAHMGTTFEEMELVRQKKAGERGKFRDRWIMVKNKHTAS